ncbi:MAG: hypothetical protein A2W99_08800 [Bacteroidetes bacterium GWF2_33_16]|nr:MAG: hypothetical protein A2X00_00355 [Bacteroidetes bacterium GWE2_32_14]OFY05598.1 MAG: hypothetical protein A2W99_08800 [Bacteroidetes bacterium GWF2_33_16]
MAKAQIIIFEQSPIILGGLKSIIEKISIQHELHPISNASDFLLFLKNNKTDLIIANIELLKELKTANDIIRKNRINLIFLQSNDTLPQNDLHYDELIEMGENEDQIIKKVIGCLGELTHQKSNKKAETISSREENILREIALGFSNKEIADKLFISQHTVITHRKNITRKLGIKSVSGLTIYAILNKLISMDEVK